MRVFMLGWEFPPFISGGLGTACYGLTKALSRLGTDVTFVLPKPVGSEFTSHVKVLAPQSPKAALGDRAPESVAASYAVDQPQVAGEFAHVTFKAVPARFRSPYGGAAMGALRRRGDAIGGPVSDAQAAWHEMTPAGAQNSNGSEPVTNAPFTQYCGDLLAESRRYAALCVDLARGEDFDVIHAHDWLTYPAGMAVAAATGRPLIVHVHSTEFDRAGEHINQQVYDIERRGMHAADRVFAVSELTKSIVVKRYGVPDDKVSVVYNGIDNGHEAPSAMQRAMIRRGEKIVLFLGRVTMQKGPEYFLRAARKVLEKIQNVKFVIAGSGDMIQNVVEMVAAEGIGHKVLFTGFLAGQEVDRVFRMADVYVMPSVSEPFGIAPLEAISHDVPVIISKTSGVAEVLTHALKVDFWDTDEIANKIVAVLRHPPLATTLRQHADSEVRRLTWAEAANRCNNLYTQAMHG